MSIHPFLITILVAFFAYAPHSFSNDIIKDTSTFSVSIATPEINHLYIVLKQSSIDSIAHTPFVREHFSAFEQREVDAGSMSWSGTYLKGQRAYLELFPPGELEEFEEGMAGIALSTSRLGQIQTASAALTTLAGDDVVDGLRVRVLDGDTISWFNYLNLNSPDTFLFFSWLMEFTEEYLQSTGVIIDSNKSFDRHAYLSAKDAPASVVPTSTTLFDDIVEVYCELTGPEHSHLELLARAFGINSKSIGDSTTYAIGDCNVIVRTNEMRKYCIRRIVCSMTKAIDSPVSFSFGPDARLEVKEDLAIWYFGIL